MTDQVLGVQATDAQLEAMQIQVDRAKKEVEQANLFLDQATRDLRTQLLSAVKVLSALIELRSPVLAQHSRRVADLSRFLALELSCSDFELLNIYIAAILHDIGKLGLSDHILDSAFMSLDGGHRLDLNKHPLRGYAVLAGLQDLHVSASYIRHHHERFDGQGIPDGLLGDKIPKGARILAVAEDYDELQLGWQSNKKLSDEQALAFIQGAVGKRYDPAVVEALPKALEHLNAYPREDESIVHVNDLQVGMKISRDLNSPEGMLLLAHDKMVTLALIQRLKEFKYKGQNGTKVYVYKNTIVAKTEKS